MRALSIFGLSGVRFNQEVTLHARRYFGHKNLAIFVTASCGFLKAIARDIVNGMGFGIVLLLTRLAVPKYPSLVPLEFKLLLVAYGVVFVLAAVAGEIALHVAKWRFGAGRVGRELRRHFNWTCRQAGACIYFASSLNSLRNPPLGIGAEFGSAIIALQVGAIMIGALFAWWAVRQWQDAWAN